ncbi:MAG: hypothetical protein HYZ46_00760 [Nitrosomonadales bacterium]|nr:hypothetical protein [Nitrosomonadales bacterium]
MGFNDRLLFVAKRLIFVASIVLSGCAMQPTIRSDEILPMYGQPEAIRSDEQKWADEEFIKQAAASFSGSRERASTALWREGEEQVDRGNLDFAMKRYNQSWLLNPNNYRPYWGFGRVLAQKEKPDEAIAQLERALQLIDDPYQKVALLSDRGMVYSQKAFYTNAENKRELAHWFELANASFEESTSMDASYKNSWFGWARSLYFEGRYAEAWVKVKKARELGVSFPISFIKSLGEKMTEPQ